MRGQATVIGGTSCRHSTWCWVPESGTVGTNGDQRRLKKRARFLAGTKEVHFLFKPHAKDGKPVVQVMVGANRADDAIDKKSTSGGVLHFYGCAIATGLGVSLAWR